jgi:hypothetical protein
MIPVHFGAEVLYSPSVNLSATEIDGNNALYIKSIEVPISTFETLPVSLAWIPTLGKRLNTTTS